LPARFTDAKGWHPFKNKNQKGLHLIFSSADKTNAGKEKQNGNYAYNYCCSYLCIVVNYADAGID
jgi:hypothetical protein